MREFSLSVNELRDACKELRAGDRVFLSGTVFTARDAAHKRIFECLEQQKPLPFLLRDAVIYYAGPTPTTPGKIIGSCGPTTASRMDGFAPALYDRGVLATVGKGPRSAAVCDAVCRNKAVYLCALGGAGALAAGHITDCREIAFPDLGCESVKQLTFDRFPLTVGMDCSGGNLFQK